MSTLISNRLEVEDDDRPRSLTWLQAAFWATLFGPLLLLCWVGWQSYHDTLNAGRDRLVRLAQIATEQSQRIVETNEVISRGIASRVGSKSNRELMENRQDLHAALRSWTAELRQLQSVWIWDDEGRPIATNLRADPPATLDVSDREYFRWAKQTESRGWFVSEPLRSRTTGQLFFDLSKRRSAPDGSFLGVISVSLLPAYFDEFFRQQVESDPGLTLSLLRADGTFLSRYPAAPGTGSQRLGVGSPLLAAMRANSPNGVTEGVSSVDGELRLVAHRRVGDLPLYAAATASKRSLLLPWRKSMALLAGFTIPLSAGLAALCWFGMRRVRREHAIAAAHREQYEQRLKAEEALRHAQKMEALGRLTGGVAHDFNNVLMVVQTSVSLMRRLQERGEATDKPLSTIQRAVTNGAQLTRQLLAVVRRQPLQLRTLELAEVIPQVAQLLASTLGSSIKVEHEVPAELFVTVDQSELELALINLCINAKDAMPDGGRVSLCARLTQPPAEVTPSTPWIRLTVSDTGEGIPQEILARVTEPFFTTKELGRGTGLGLSQVQSFVSQAGGRLEITSESGRGTDVAILLPSVVTRSDAPVSVAPSTQQVDGSVLLVEDNLDIGEAIASMLREAGADVIWFTSADDAMRALEGDKQFDTVLSDVSLPGNHSGIDLARFIAASRPSVGVVLMTGYTNYLQEAVAAGFRVVPKPATPEVLIDAVISARALAARKHLPGSLDRSPAQH